MRLAALPTASHDCVFRGNSHCRKDDILTNPSQVITLILYNSSSNTQGYINATQKIMARPPTAVSCMKSFTTWRKCV